MKKSFLFILMIFCCVNFVYGDVISDLNSNLIFSYQLFNATHDNSTTPIKEATIIGSDPYTTTNCPSDASGCFSNDKSTRYVKFEDTSHKSFGDADKLFNLSNANLTITYWAEVSNVGTGSDGLKTVFDSDQHTTNGRHDSGFLISYWDKDTLNNGLCMSYRIPITQSEVKHVSTNVVDIDSTSLHFVTLYIYSHNYTSQMFRNNSLMALGISSEPTDYNGMNYDNKFYIGAQEGSSGDINRFFAGKLQHFYVFDKALTEQERTYLWNNGTPLMLNHILETDTTNPTINSITISDMTPSQWDTIYINVSATDDRLIDYILLYDNRTGTFSSIGNYSCSSSNCNAEFSTTAQEGTIQFKAKAVDTSGNFIESDVNELLNEQEYILNQNAVLKYHFHNHSYDNSTNKANGFPTNNNLWNNSNCLSDKSGCFSGDGSNNFISNINLSGTTASFLTNPGFDKNMTWTAHMNIEAKGNYQLMTSTYTDGGICDTNAYPYFDDLNKFGFIYKGTTARYNLAPADFGTIGNWHHYTVIINSTAGKAYLYIDSEIKAEVSKTTSDLGTTICDGLDIGKYVTGASTYATLGKLQGMYWFNRSLTLDEIKYLNSSVILGDGKNPTYNYPNTYTATAYCQDSDGDGYGVTYSTACQYEELDCDDTNANKHPPSNGALYNSPKTFCPGSYSLPSGVSFMYTINFGDTGNITIN